MPEGTDPSGPRRSAGRGLGESVPRGSGGDGGVDARERRERERAAAEFAHAGRTELTRQMLADFDRLFRGGGVK